MAYSGPLQRRHVHVAAVRFVGKEADRWEEDEQFGANEDSAIEYDLSADARADAAETLRSVLASKAATHTRLARAAKVSEHTVGAALNGAADVDSRAITRLIKAAGQLESEHKAAEIERRELLEWARSRVREEGVSAVASRVGVDPANLRKVLAGRRHASQALLADLRRVRASGSAAVSRVDDAFHSNPSSRGARR
jgi:plasmid maintenance system antidote protein VapI